jgi:threonylcarbamoyladenosine tRNA methylthiotransferase MtaB
MRTFSINTLGCKVNQYESQQIRQLLEQLGLGQVELSKGPDLAVINTCCVTRTASAKSRQYVRKARRLSPHAVTIVCGCLPSVKIGELNGLEENIHLIGHKDGLAARLIQIVNAKLPAESELPPLTSFKGQTRAFLKVQDGCDGNCTYCIIPRARPVVQSKPVEAVLQEAKALAEAGHKEIVVTGVFLGAYGQKSVRRRNWPSQQSDKLADLLDKMAQIPNLARIRLSSLEPADVTPHLLDTFCEHRNVMPHLHLSLQSGSNAVLRAMARQYTADEFEEKVALIKSRLDRPAISTDIIVGFPGETDADFEQTVELAKKVGFAKMHIFAFSPRKGTAAAAMQGTVDNKVIKERSRILRDLDKQSQTEFRQRFVGETADVLLESGGKDATGRAARYFIVEIQKSSRKRLRKNDLVTVELVENCADSVRGELI